VALLFALTFSPGTVATLTVTWLTLPVSGFLEIGMLIV
jgi:hypothetical protein